VLFDKETKAELLAMSERAEGVTVEEALAHFPVQLTPEQAMEIATKRKMQDFLHSNGAWAVFPSGGDSGQPAYRSEKNLTVREIEQIMSDADKRELRAQHLKETMNKRRVERLKTEVVDNPQLLIGDYRRDVLREIKSLEQTVQSMGAP